MKPTFTTKHYNKLAAFWKYELSIAAQVSSDLSTNPVAENRFNTIKGCIRLQASMLENDNERFNRQLFYDACGLQESVRQS